MSIDLAKSITAALLRLSAFIDHLKAQTATIDALLLPPMFASLPAPTPNPLYDPPLAPMPEVLSTLLPDFLPAFTPVPHPRAVVY